MNFFLRSSLVLKEDLRNMDSTKEAKREAENQQSQKDENHLDRLISNLVGYVDTQFKLFQLEVKSELSNAITMLILVLIIGIFVGVAGLLLSFALAQYLGQLLGSAILGYCVVGGFYLLIAGVMIGSFKKIRQQISVLIHKKIKQIDIAKQEKLNP